MNEKNVHIFPESGPLLQAFAEDEATPNFVEDMAANVVDRHHRQPLHGEHCRYPSRISIFPVTENSKKYQKCGTRFIFPHSSKSFVSTDFVQEFPLTAETFATSAAMIAAAVEAMHAVQWSHLADFLRAVKLDWKAETK